MPELRKPSRPNLMTRPSGEELEPVKKKLRAALSSCDRADNLRELLFAAIPDKQPFFDTWLAALADPAVCVATVGDVQRLDPVDIAGLPVPPIVKGVFREVLSREVDKTNEQRYVLDVTMQRSREFLSAQRDRNMQPGLAGSKYFQDCKKYRLILTREELEAGVRIVARRIETWSKGERIILVGILKGAFMFMSDLCRILTRPYSVYFVEASSYKDGRIQGAGVSISTELAISKFTDATTKAPHKIVLIDELLDNGKTMHEMRQYFLSSLAATHTDNDILTCCLMSKQRDRSFPEADITGIPDLPDLWLVGYGLDDRGTKRGWVELFAMPKVKLVDTIEEREVEKLLTNLDNSATLVQPLVFGGFELTCNHKQKYRVFGVDVLTGHTMVTPSHRTLTKADVTGIVKGVNIVKGKYEHELQFAFIQEGVELVPEDAIFSGDNKVFAEMRCRLRKHLHKEAQRFNVQGPGELVVSNGATA
mmetsp:Transcript_69382/g.201031  ORF Transcript_69382/g.201031 Transcript_69382/m.201031 type:complete len:478 (-) Transcript_69382:224-1657(-)